MTAPPDDPPKSPPRSRAFVILVHGVLGWGVPFFLLMLAWDWIEAGHPPPPMNIASLACLSAFGGFILGRWILKDPTRRSRPVLRAAARAVGPEWASNRPADS